VFFPRNSEHLSPGQHLKRLDDLDTTSKQMSRSFVLVPIDFSYVTSYRLSIGPSNLLLL